MIPHAARRAPREALPSPLALSLPLLSSTLWHGDAVVRTENTIPTRSTAVVVAIERRLSTVPLARARALLAIGKRVLTKQVTFDTTFEKTATL